MLTTATVGLLGAAVPIHKHGDYHPNLGVHFLGNNWTLVP
jgi:hypothetical protein